MDNGTEYNNNICYVKKLLKMFNSLYTISGIKIILLSLFVKDQN